MKRKIIPYNPYLKEKARYLRNNSTKSEIFLWKRIKANQVHGYRFMRQKPLLDFIADFYCYELKLVIELDGYSHQFEEVRKKDKLKQNRLEKEGLTVLRYTDSEVFDNIEFVLRSIEGHVKLIENA